MKIHIHTKKTTFFLPRKNNFFYPLKTASRWSTGKQKSVIEKHLPFAKKGEWHFFGAYYGIFMNGSFDFEHHHKETQMTLQWMSKKCQYD